MKCQHNLVPQPAEEAVDSEEIFVVNLAERNATLLFEDAQNPIWSPDGKQLAFLSSEWMNLDVFIYDFEQNNKVTLNTTTLVEEEISAIALEDWSPDSTKIALLALVPTPLVGMPLYKDSSAFIVDIGSLTAEQLVNPADITYVYGVAWGRDVNELYFQDVTDEGYSLLKLNTENSELETVINLESYFDTDGMGWPTHPDVAPDGRIVFQSFQGDIYLFNPETQTIGNLTNTNTSPSRAYDVDSHPRWMCRFN